MFTWIYCKIYPSPSLLLSWIHPTSSISCSIPSPFQLFIHNITTSPLSSSVYHLLILSMLPHFLSLFIHPSVHLSIHPFISIGMWEVKWTHLMGLCVSRKWSARVSHWLYRWATRCCPRLPWCQRKCHISWVELEKKKFEKYRNNISISNLQPLVHSRLSSICNITLQSLEMSSGYLNSVNWPAFQL